MTATRLTAASLTLLVAFGVQAAQGAPLRATRSLRATWCCATTCHHAPTSHGTRECCQARDGDSDTATVRATPTVREPITLAIAVVPPLLAQAAPFRISAEPAFTARGAPVFLLTRSLRL